MLSIIQQPLACMHSRHMNDVRPSPLSLQLLLRAPPLLPRAPVLTHANCKNVRCVGSALGPHSTWQGREAVRRALVSANTHRVPCVHDSGRPTPPQQPRFMQTA